MATLPVTNMNITTATRKRDKVVKQAFANIKCNHLEITHPVLIVNKLAHDGIMGIDLLKEIEAEINPKQQIMLCTYNGVRHELKLNTALGIKQQEHTTISKSASKYEAAVNKIPSQEASTEEREALQKVLQEYHDIFRGKMTQTTVYQHHIAVSDPEKVIRRTEKRSFEKRIIAYAFVWM